MTPERQNRKARRTLAAQTRKGQEPQPTDGSKTITGKAYTRNDKGEWIEMFHGMDVTVTWVPDASVGRVSP